MGRSLMVRNQLSLWSQLLESLKVEFSSFENLGEGACKSWDRTHSFSRSFRSPALLDSEEPRMLPFPPAWAQEKLLGDSVWSPSLASGLSMLCSFWKKRPAMESIRKIVLGGLLSQTHPEQKAVLTGLSVVVNCSPSRVGLAHRKCLNCPLWTRKQFFKKKSHKCPGYFGPRVFSSRKSHKKWWTLSWVVNT